MKNRSYIKSWRIIEDKLLCGHEILLTIFGPVLVDKSGNWINELYIPSVKALFKRKLLECVGKNVSGKVYIHTDYQYNDYHSSYMNIDL